MEQEILQQAYLLERQSKELEENASLLENEINELAQFKVVLSALAKSKEQLILSSIGKGVYLKASILERALFVEVGRKVVVKKSPEEVQRLIDAQIKKLELAKEQVVSKLEIYHSALASIISQIEELGSVQENKED